jgi:predicted branched-subunit amino acid permease
MWVFVGLGIAACACADAAFAVQQARGVPESGHYDFVWTLGALFIAYSAWVRSPTVHDDDRQVAGMRAIALVLIAQALAIGIQVIAIFKEIGKSERVVTTIVLLVASVEIVLTRPKANAEKDTVPSVPSAQAGDLPASDENTG